MDITEIKETIPKEDLLAPRTILCGFRGSISQGTYLPSEDPTGIDDIDIMAVYVAHNGYYVGLGNADPEYNTKGAYDKFIGEWDSVSYEVRKFFNLLLKSNPNVISMLWLRDEHYIDMNNMGMALIENRHMFSSQLTWNAFHGYATDQFKKMMGSVREEGTYYYNPMKPLYQKVLNVASAGYLFPRTLVRVKSRGLGYMGAKRKAMVKKFGYDCKNASHLIRLLRMGIEMLATGKLNVYREEDASELIDIKRGKWTLDQVKAESDVLFKEMKRASKKSRLPELPDRDGAEKLLTKIIMGYVG